jgi:hypothetical protein
MQFTILTDEDKALNERDELADKGRYDEHDNPMPPECERCGGSFVIRKLQVSEDELVWSGATTIGDRWVCNDCEQPEYDDYWFDLEAAIDQMHEDEFSAGRDEGEF